MAKIRDKFGNEKDGFVVTEGQRLHYERWQATKSPEGKRTAAEDRAKARASRSKDEQVALLDGRPGDAKKERAKL